MVVKTTPKGSLYKEPIQPRGYASQRSPWGGLIWALNYFKPFKSTGTDGITLAQTLKCMQLIGPRLLLNTLERLTCTSGEAYRETCYWEFSIPSAKSVDTALHARLWLKWTLLYKEHAVGTFLDIEGEFNSVRLEVVISALRRFDVELNL